MRIWKKSQAARHRNTLANFHYRIYENRTEIENNVWYRLHAWHYPPNYLRMERAADPDWKCVLFREEEVIGTNLENRVADFIQIADKPGFEIFLEKDTDDPFDNCAIRIMGAAVVNGTRNVRYLGHLSKETAFLLKNEKNLKAGSASVLLPTYGCRFVLKIQILIRDPFSVQKQDRPKFPEAMREPSDKTLFSSLSAPL